jgi:hypothetical protein
MTSYQNIAESQIEGYNDCPVVDQLLVSKPAAVKPRRKRLVAHDLNATRSNSPSAVSGTVPRVTPISSRKSSAVNVLSDAVKVTDNESSFDNVNSALNALLSKPNGLPTREFEHYSQKTKTFLSDEKSWSRLSASDGSVLLSAITGDFSSDGKIIKSKLMTLILNNEGFGTWCLPLIKILENVKN